MISDTTAGPPDSSIATAVDTSVDAYVQSLTPKERKAYHIAHTHLGTSFDMDKSVGYIAFVQQMKRKEEEGASRDADA